MATKEEKEIIIATNRVETALYIFAQNAVDFDLITLTYSPKFAATVEYLIRFLRKGFGWLERERGAKEVENTRCRYNHSNYCQNSEVVRKDNTKLNVKCTETVRKSCKYYSQLYVHKIEVHYIELEKVGAIRGL